MLLSKPSGRVRGGQYKANELVGDVTASALATEARRRPSVDARPLAHRHELLPARQLRRGRLGHRGALEEPGVLRAPEVHGVGEDEVAEVVLRDASVLDQFVRLRQRM